MLFTLEEIKELNKGYGRDEGIFLQPTNIPATIKTHVIYMRYSDGGMTGGNCWNDDAPHHYSNDDRPDFDILNDVLERVAPALTYLQYRKVEKLIEDGWGYSEWEYYGNSTDYAVKFIVLDKLEELLKELGYV